MHQMTCLLTSYRNMLAKMIGSPFSQTAYAKHGSWLNMVEGFFGKMTKRMFRGIRVKSREELAECIYLYFSEVNEEPVVFH